MKERKEIEYEIDKRGCHICTSHEPWMNGYLAICINGKRTHMHRWLYEQKYGDAGLDIIHHICLNMMCININHLEKLSRREHVRLHQWKVMR